MSEGRILVAGATGYVGGRLVPRLLEHGHTVRALARNPRKFGLAAAAGAVDVAQGDVLDRASLTSAVTDVDVAYYLVHSMGAGSAFHAADIEGARNFGEACSRAGVRRIIFLGALGDPDADLSEHLRSRQATGDALREAGVPVTELRAGIVVGSGSASFEIIHDLARRLPVMVTPRWVESRCEPIAIRNVLDYLAGALTETRTVGEVLEIGSGDVMTYGDLLRVCGQELGREPHLLTVPVLTPRLSSYWLHLVTSVDMQVARPLVEGLRTDSVCRDTRIRQWLPVPLLSYRDAVRLALEKREAPRQRESRWTDASRRQVRPAGRPPQPRRRRVGMFTDYRTFDTGLTPAELYARVESIGGQHGYGASVDALWRLRGAVDRMVGGAGLQRGRPFGSRLHEGDAVDFWRVARARPPHRLSLVAEMRVPGTARLDFVVEPLPGGGARLHQHATLTRESWLSSAYWYAIAPIHDWVFDQLGHHILSGPSRRS